MMHKLLGYSAAAWLFLTTGIAAGACNQSREARPPGTWVGATVERDRSPDVSEQARTTLLENNAELAFDLYRLLGESEENLVFSPISISLVNAMLYGGARGQTAAQMAEALSFELPEDQLHPAFNWLELALLERDDDDEAVRLEIVDAIFSQAGFSFRDAYLDLLARSYGAGMALLDFQNEPDQARSQINDWVAKQTNERITELLPDGTITPATVLVLVNAVYFKAPWNTPFNPSATSDRAFHAPDGDVIVPMMYGQPQRASYALRDGYQAVALPYRGGAFDMVFVMPEEGRFAEIEGRLGAGMLASLFSALQRQRMELIMPHFELRTAARLDSMLRELGMVDAFTRDADFSGMSERRDLYLSVVQHEAFIRVDESGTEAAAATAGGVDLVSIPIRVVLDRPFLFFIRDVETGSVLFLGRVLDPS